VKTYKYLCRYFHDDRWWELEIFAYDSGDAESRARKLGVQLLGKHIATVRAAKGMSFAVRFICWIRNLGFTNYREIIWPHKQ
jgi:hypothetical protein